MENGLKTGIRAFDEMVGEVQPGELIVIAGRPGMGKTTLMLQILAKNCIDKKCAFISSESDIFMSMEDRICCILGNLNRYENEKEVWESVNEVIENKLDETLHLLTSDFISLCIELTKIKQEKGLDYVFIDYFQVFAPDVSANLRAKWLKDLAVSLGITIFVTTQIHRGRDYDRIDCTTVNYHLYYLADKVFGVYRKDCFMRIKDMEQIRNI